MLKKELIGGLSLVFAAITLLLPGWTLPEKKLAEKSWSKLAKPVFTMCRSGGQFLLQPLIDYTEPIAPKLKGLGELHFKVTTDSKDAQAFFNQGLRLVYGFNHAEAYRAFQEASRLDPSCAMAYWGQALALGPNINDPLPDMARQKIAYQAIKKAMTKQDGATAMEKALMSAYQKRCTNGEQEQPALNTAYAAAMKAIYQQFPDHVEVGTFYAASIMNTMPWDYYDENLRPKAMTTEAVDALEKVLAAQPRHPGAHHYYIHVIEAVNPDKAVSSADALGSLMPGAGHIVHMPSHIYIGVGMYEKAVRVNRQAIAADEEYIAQCQAQGLYPLSYYPHNIHFLWAATTMQGNSEEAIDAAEKVALRIPVNQASEIHFLQDFMSVPLQAYTRFGRWNDILSTPAPDTSLLHATLIWHYARGMAFTRLGKFDLAEESLDAVRDLTADHRSEAIFAAYTNPTSQVGQVAVEALTGELAAEKGEYEEAIRHLTAAVDHELNLAYQEPSAWHYPARHSLGAVLLEAGKASEAETVYRADLQKNRDNGWALFGLHQSLQAQGKTKTARKVKQQFEEAWKHADVALTSSRF